VRSYIPRIFLKTLSDAEIESSRFADGDAILVHKRHHHWLGEQLLKRDFRSESHFASPYRHPLMGLTGKCERIATKINSKDLVVVELYAGLQPLGQCRYRPRT